MWGTRPNVYTFFCVPLQFSPCDNTTVIRGASTRKSRYGTQRSKAIRKLAPMDTRSIRSPLRLPTDAPMLRAAGEIKTLPLVLKTAACPEVAREREILAIKCSIRRNRENFICTSVYQITLPEWNGHTLLRYNQQLSVAVFLGNCVREFHLRALKLTAVNTLYSNKIGKAP